MAAAGIAMNHHVKTEYFLVTVIDYSGLVVQLPEKTAMIL